MLPADRSRHAHRPGPGRPPVSPLVPCAPFRRGMVAPGGPAMEQDDHTFSTDSAAGGLMCGRYVFLTSPAALHWVRFTPAARHETPEQQVTPGTHGAVRALSSARISAVSRRARERVVPVVRVVPARALRRASATTSM